MKRKWFSVFPLIALFVMLAVPQTVSAISEDDVRAWMATVNDQLAAAGEDFRLGTVEYYTNGDEAGQIVYFDNRTLQLSHHWVPGDPRRGGYYDISWLSDLQDGTANPLTLEQTQAAVDRAMATWDEAQCATIPLTRLPDYGINWGYVHYFYCTCPDCPPGGFPGWFADVTQAGWLPGSFFECVLGPGTSGFVLAVTFTFIWTEGGIPTDIDNNGKMDTAFREVYYNNEFEWAIDANFDVETIVLHENGHSLSLGHFGKAFRTEPNWKLHFAPRAVMNAGYSGVQQELTTTDLAAFCSVWSSWPNN